MANKRYQPLTPENKVRLLEEKYNAEGMPNIHRSTEKFDSILQQEIDEGRYSKEELQRINRTRSWRMKEKNQP